MLTLRQKLGLEYDSCIIDPAKKNVMLHVYDPQFLSALAKQLKPRASVVAYVPDGGVSPRFNRMRDELIAAFEGTKQFRLSRHFEGDKFIYCFERAAG